MGIYQDQQTFAEAEQERYFLNALPLVRRIARRKLGGASGWETAEDLVQKIGLNLWRWRTGRNSSGAETEITDQGIGNQEAKTPVAKDHNQSSAAEKDLAPKDLTQEEWLRLANRAAHNEIKSYYRQRYRRQETLVDSHSEQTAEETIGRQSLTFASSLKIEGNSRAEVASLLNRVWQIVETFPLKRKYSYLLGKEELIIDLITHGVATRKTLAHILEMPIEEFDKIIKNLPVSDDRIAELLTGRCSEEITPRQVWTWRAKAKRKLLAELEDQL